MSETKERLRPALPAELTQPEPAWVVAYFAYSFGLYFGCGYLSYATAMSSWPLLIKIPVIIVMAALASNGIHLLGFLSHDGMHLSIVKNKTANMLLGTFAGSVLFLPSIGFGISHWPHHKYTNMVDDPDTYVHPHSTTFWNRFFFSRIRANRQFFKNGFAAMLKRPRNSTYRMPFSDNELSFYSALGFGLMVLWAIFYITVGMNNPEYLLFAFVLPYMFLLPITGLRFYIEHTGTQSGEFQNSRSYISPFYTALLFGNNYHQEHHLYPKVPGYKLHKVHKKLSEEGYYERHNSHIVRGVIAPLRYTTKHYLYPDSRNAARTSVPPQTEGTANA